MNNLLIVLLLGLCFNGRTCCFAAVYQLSSRTPKRREELGPVTRFAMFIVQP